MSTSDIIQFVCEKHPYLSFTTQKALDKHLTYAPSHIIPKTPQLSGLPHHTSAVLGALSVNGDDRWSSISVSEELELLTLLSNECHSVKDLLKERHLLHVFTAEEIEGFQQCRICGVTKNQSATRKGLRNFHPGQRSKRNREGGVLTFSCCGLDGSKKGCQTCESHDFRETAKMDITRKLARTPQPDGTPRYKAVVLDCEMVCTVEGLNEVIIVSLVDYMRKEVLMDTYVQPAHKVSNWATRCHGVTPSIMNKAIRNGKALDGWEAARQEVWKFVDADTIIIGHAVKNDLDVLGMIHHQIVDSAILSKYISGGHNQWSLDRLVKDFLNVPFRLNAGGIHNCLEDVMATREVVLYCTRHHADVATWGALRKKEHEIKVEENRIRREKEGKGGAKREDQEKEKIRLGMWYNEP